MGHGPLNTASTCGIEQKMQFPTNIRSRLITKYNLRKTMTRVRNRDINKQKYRLISGQPAQ
jgi:hypothetical protein